jgi:hypothetical protein
MQEEKTRRFYSRPRLTVRSIAPAWAATSTRISHGGILVAVPGFPKE